MDDNLTAMDIDRGIDVQEEVYSNMHRAFLQSMMSRRVMDVNTAKGLFEILVSIAEQTHGEQDFQEFISAINFKINPYNLTIRCACDEVTGQDILLLVNTTSDFATQCATLYSPGELEYFKHLLNAIMESSQFSLPVNEALEIGRQKPIRTSLKKAKEILDRLVQDEWLCYYDDDEQEEGTGYYFLSSRTRVELLPYFEQQSYVDSIGLCLKCLEMVTTGRQCRHCHTYVHTYCLSVETSEQHSNGSNTKAEFLCPTCSEYMHLFGLLMLIEDDDADEEEEEENQLSNDSSSKHTSPSTNSTM